ncbi:MAG TPA: class E sortase [Acidimicrobiales bacterium]|nr:class E sortase [Acidimicrobiales bacterium]
MGKPARRRLLPGSGRTWLREAGLALVVGGFVVLLFAAYELVGTNLSEENSQSVLARDFATALAHAPKRVITKETTATSGQSALHSTAGDGTAGDSTAGDSTAGDRTAGHTGSRVGQTNNDVSGGAGQTGASPAGQGHQAQAGQPALPRDLIGISLRLPPPGGALDHLVIPAINLSRYVVQGVDESDLQMGPGHYPGTPLPGQPGNVGIAGHRTTFGAPFFRLNEVSRGDLILLTDTSGTTWVYSVVHQWVVSPNDTAVLDPTRDAMLTLTTCNPRFEAISRLVVRAALVERLPSGAKLPTGSTGVASGLSHPVAPEQAPAIVTPTQAPATTGGANGEGSPTVGSASSSSSGSEAWLATIGFALLALVGWVATRLFAAHLRRHSKVLVLAAGVLVCLIPLWFAFENLVDLLPANI